MSSDEKFLFLPVSFTTATDFLMLHTIPVRTCHIQPIMRFSRESQYHDAWLMTCLRALRLKFCCIPLSALQALSGAEIAWGHLHGLWRNDTAKVPKGYSPPQPWPWVHDVRIHHKDIHLGYDIINTLYLFIPFDMAPESGTHAGLPFSTTCTVLLLE